MSDLEGLRDALTGSMTAGGWRDGTGQRLTRRATEDATGGSVETWRPEGEPFACGLRAFTLRDAQRVGATLTDAEYTLHAAPDLPLSPADRVTVTDPRNPSGVTVELVRVMRGRVKTEALCRGIP